LQVPQQQRIKKIFIHELFQLDRSKNCII